MASTAIPRWKTLLASAIEKYPKETVLQIATIDPIAPIPHVRSHIFRQFLSNPKKLFLPLLISSTDIRTPKVTQILNNPNIEAAWWIDSTKEQYRISGRVSLVTSPTHERALYETTRKALLMNASVDFEGGLALLTPNGPGEYDWESKRLEIFRNMSSHMKASWCRPVPGSVLVGGPDEAKKWPEKVEEPSEDEPEDSEARKNWNTALNNFALVVIEPSEVDYLTMAVVPNRRFKFSRSVKGGWEEVEVVP